MAWVTEYKGVRKHTWTVHWRDHRGKERQKTFRTKKEAVRYKRILEGDKARGVTEPSRMPFSDWWNYFIEVANLRPKTRAQYRRYAKNNLLPFFGRMELGAIRRSHISNWLVFMKDRMVPASSVRESFVVLRSALSRAVFDEEIAANPCEGVAEHLPKMPPPMRRPVLSPMQVVALADAVDARYRLAILAMGVLGLRPGEVIGLRLGDVDLNTGKLTVRSSVVNAEGRMVEGPPKNDKVQEVPLGFLKPAFQTHIRGMGTLDRQALLFPARISSGFLHTDTLRLMVKRAGAKIGLDEGMTSKVLRSSAATNALIYGNIRWASDLLRHSDEKVTLEHYIKLTQGMNEESWQRLSDAYGMKPPDEKAEQG
jgi:integrase